MSRIKRCHKWLGPALLLGWSITGAVFLFKPGYGDAYSALYIKTDPIVERAAFERQPSGLEYRQVRTLLGEHLRVRDHNGWQQRHPTSLQVLPAPSHEDIARLLEDAIAVKPQRYGERVGQSDLGYSTDTQVTLNFDWHTLALSQPGQDRVLIDTRHSLSALERPESRG